MKSNATAQKAQENVIPKMTIVQPSAEKSVKNVQFKASAEEVTSEPIAQEETPGVITITEVMKKVNEEFNAKPEKLAIPIITEKPVQSIEDIKRKSEVLSRLTVKWDTLAEKRRRVENFAISHDGDTASAIVRDSQGEVFESNSPKTIGKLIEFWKAEFSEAIANVEKEMREIA